MASDTRPLVLETPAGGFILVGPGDRILVGAQGGGMEESVVHVNATGTVTTEVYSGLETDAYMRDLRGAFMINGYKLVRNPARE